MTALSSGSLEGGGGITQLKHPSPWSDMRVPLPVLGALCVFRLAAALGIFGSD